MQWFQSVPLQIPESQIFQELVGQLKSSLAGPLHVFLPLPMEASLHDAPSGHMVQSCLGFFEVEGQFPLRFEYPWHRPPTYSFLYAARPCTQVLQLLREYVFRLSPATLAALTPQ
jgi:hypothetical protein